jgi:glycoside/pentoside/hexuronide:cation symporter, GPH family
MTAGREVDAPSMVKFAPLNHIDTLSYAMGSFGTGVFSTVPAVLLLYFCTETLKISGSTASVRILLPKLWSIAWDRLVGSWWIGRATLGADDARS